MSWLLKSVAINAPYPLAVFSPGNKHDEVIAMLHSAEGFVDQFILVCCPSAIGHLILRAKGNDRSLPLHKMSYLVIGEAFPEGLREGLEKSAPASDSRMFSVYGSADTGLLGFESPASVILRRICMADSLVAEDLGLGCVIPHFFHHADPAPIWKPLPANYASQNGRVFLWSDTTCTTALAFTTGRTLSG